MSFTDEAIAAAMPLWEAAADTLFLKEMGEGTLGRRKFLEYIVQDSIYLRDYAKTYAMAVYKSRTIKEMQIFCSALGFVNDSENVTRLRYLADLGMSDDEIDSAEKKPACAAYTAFLLDCAREEETPEILMAVMPCMLGYYFVFDRLVKRYPAVLSSYFGALAADYTSDAYRHSCEVWTGYCDEMCGGLSADRKQKLIDIFVKASEHELYFWRMAGGENG